MRILRVFIIVTFILASKTLSAQELLQLDNNVADCATAIDITGLNTILASAPIGVGNWNEIQSPKKSLYAFKKEHHTVWYKFKVQQSCQLLFRITPDNPKNDYDFILYKADGEKTCRSIRKGELKPVRTNISRPTEINKGITGLSSNGKSAYVHEGKGNNWSLPLDVLAGEVYYLVLDNVYENGQGHRIDFLYKNCHGIRKDGVKPLSVNINVKDAKTKRLIKGQIIIVDESQGYPNYDTVYNKRGSSLFYAIKPNIYYSYEVRSEEYLYQKGIFRMDSNSRERTRKIDVELIQVKVGESFELQDLYFAGGKATVVRKSYPTLRKLLAIMKDNPGLRIEVQGHVNLPASNKKHYSEEHYNQLSVARAQTVKQYLDQRGIESSRMSVSGFGYSKMIYPKATTPEQMQRNRRVVIKITAL